MAIRAALDVGSNSIKLLVADVQPDGSYRVLEEASEITGMAAGLAPGGSLDPARAQQTLEVLRRFRDRAQELGAERIVAAGTAALRDAGDAAQFLARVRSELQLGVRVLSGAEEARLGRSVALRELPPGSPDVVFFDIGGGSTELTVLHDGTVRAETSLQLGARRATDAAQLSQPVTPRADADVRAYVAQRLAQGAPPLATGAAPRIAGLGGTATTVVQMLKGQQGEPRCDPHGAVVTLEQLDGLLADIAPLALEQLEVWPNMNPARAPVIYAGICIIAGLLRHYGCGSLTLLDRGLRYGLLLAGDAAAHVE
jgi:exopolyphosphatase/guanosine-5'-triphosphate,3'-diphosphate pyrophosphatase